MSTITICNRPAQCASKCSLTCAVPAASRHSFMYDEGHRSSGQELDGADAVAFFPLVERPLLAAIGTAVVHPPVIEDEDGTVLDEIGHELERRYGRFIEIAVDMDDR